QHLARHVASPVLVERFETVIRQVRSMATTALAAHATTRFTLRGCERPWLTIIDDFASKHQTIVGNHRDPAAGVKPAECRTRGLASSDRQSNRYRQLTCNPLPVLGRDSILRPYPDLGPIAWLFGFA